MDLNDRKLKILNAIVNDYILTAEPVGSRTIEKRYKLGVSAATIRNEMSDLEELGLLVAPHASAGRVPSDKGFRMYVDRLIEESFDNSSLEIFQNIISSNITEIENLMEQTANLISKYTNYATVVSEESFIIYRIKRIQLIPIDNEHIMLVMVFNKSIVKNEYLKTNGIYYQVEYLDTLTNALNIYLSGLLIEDINSDIMQNITSYVNEKFNVDNSIINIILECIMINANFKKDIKYYRSGVNNILEYPDLNNDISKVKCIFESIEQKDFISELLSGKDNKNNNEARFEIIIGEENTASEMKDLTVFKVRCKLDEYRYGNIGIIGPKRMNYEQTISILNTIVDTINNNKKYIIQNDDL